MTVDELNIVITAQNDEFKRRLDEVNGRLTDMEKNSDNAAKSMGNSFKTLAGIIGSLGIGKIIGDLNDAYTTQMMNEVKLETVMRKRIGASDEEIQSIKRLTSAQQELGVVGDEVQLAGAQQLATFATSASTVETLIPAMNNLMAQQNGFNSTESSAVSIANMMGKALQGQTSALTRVGISFTEAQEKVLKYGTESEKAATMAQVITDNVGNMNEALRNTSAGQLQALKNDFGDLKEQVGATFQPLITTVVPMLNEGLQAVSPLIISFSSGLSSVAQYLAQMPSSAQAVLIAAVTAAVVIPKVSSVVDVLNMKIKTSTAWLVILTSVLAAIASVGAARREMDSQTGDDLAQTANGADAAAESVDGLTDSFANLGSSGEAAKKSLADIDTLNIFSASASNTGGVDFAAVVEGAENASEAVSDVSGELAGLTADMNSVDLSGFSDMFSNTFSDIGLGISTMWNAFFGEGDEQYQSLKAWNNSIKGLFGEEWTDFFENVGKNLYKIFNGHEYEKDQALKEVQDWLQDICDGVEEKLTSVNPILGAFMTWWNDTFSQFGVYLQQAQNRAVDFMREKGVTSGFDAYAKLFSGEFTVGDVFKAAFDTESGGNGGGGSSSYTNYSHGGGGGYRYQSYDTPQTSYSSSYSPTALRDFKSLESAAEKDQTITLNITNTLDGVAIGEFSAEYSARELARSNGY